MYTAEAVNGVGVQKNGNYVDHFLSCTFSRLILRNTALKHKFTCGFGELDFEQTAVPIQLENHFQILGHANSLQTISYEQNSLFVFLFGATQLCLHHHSSTLIESVTTAAQTLPPPSQTLFKFVTPKNLPYYIHGAVARFPIRTNGEHLQLLSKHPPN